MNAVTKTWLGVVACAVMVAVTGAGDALGLGSAYAEHTHPSGLTVITGEPPAVNQIPHALDEAIGVTDALVAWFPADFATAWIDRSTETIVVGAATPAGMSIMDDVTAGRYEAVAARGYQGGGFEKPLRDLSPLSLALADGRARVRTVPNSWIDLTAVQHELTSIDPSQSTLWMTMTDDEHNRVIVGMSSLSEDMAAEIVRRYGPDLVAIRLEDPGPSSELLTG